MADASVAAIREAVREYLKGADLSEASSKKVRAHLNEKFDCDFSARKKEIERIVMDVLTEFESDDKKDSGSEDDADGSDDDYSANGRSKQQQQQQKKKPAPSRKSSTKKRSKGSDSEDDDENDDDDYGDSDGDRKKRKRTSNGASKNGNSGGGGGGGARASKGGKTTGYLKKLKLSPGLAEVMGEDHMARNEVVKKMYAIVKERELLDPKNRQFAILDGQLQKVFGQKRIRMFGMMKLLGKHFSKDD